MFVCNIQPSSSASINNEAFHSEYQDSPNIDWENDPAIQSLIDDFLNRRSIFSLEQLRRRIFESSGIIVESDFLLDKLQAKPYSGSGSPGRIQDEKTLRVVIVELNSGSEFELCCDCTVLFQYLHQPEASFALKILSDDQVQENVEESESFYELPFSTDGLDVYDSEVFYVEEEDVYDDVTTANSASKNVGEPKEVMIESPAFEELIVEDTTANESPPRLFPEIEVDGFMDSSGGSKLQEIDVQDGCSSNAQNSEIASVSLGIDHEKFLNSVLQPQTSQQPEYLLSKNHTPTLLTVPASDGYVRQYRLSCDRGSHKYYRCSKCDYISRKLHIKLHPYVKVRDGQIVTDLSTVEHHPNCRPIPAIQAVATDIDRKCRLKVKNKKVLPKISYEQGQEDIMKIAASKSLNISPENLQTYFPSWKGVRVQYRRLLGQNAKSIGSLKSSRFKEPMRIRSINANVKNSNLM